MKFIIRADVSEIIDVTVDIPEDKAKLMTNNDWSSLFHKKTDSIIKKRFPDSFVEPWQVTKENGEEIKILELI